MGLFDIFKKKEKPKEQKVQAKESLIEAHLKKGKDGLDYLECEYWDKNADLKKFYDTTKLIICTMPETLPSGRTVYNARVAHYAINDPIHLDNEGNDIGRRNQFTRIRLGMDFVKLLNDQEYQKELMNRLLDKKRIQRYINAGLQDHPSEQPSCGNYVGYIDINPETGKYGKMFNTVVGEEVHNLPEQVKAREEYKELQEKAKEKRISELEAKRAELNKQIDKQIATEKGIYTPEDNEK